MTPARKAPVKKKTNPTKHFKWDRAAFNKVMSTLAKEAKRLNAFDQSCPMSRASDIDRLRGRLRELIDWNPPNQNDPA